MYNESTIARQLVQESTAILSRYGFESLDTPIIELFDSTRLNGTYNAATNTIQINRQMIAQRPWNIVLEILKHELAHLVAHKAYGATDETSHGGSFKRAADALNLCDRAARAKTSLVELEKDLSDEQQRLLDRANKLEALAKSDNVHEAALAMNRLLELQKKYDLDAWKREQASEFSTTFIDLGGTSKYTQWHSAMASMLGRVYDLEVILVRQYNALSGRFHNGVEFVGSVSSVEMVNYAWDFIANAMRRAYKKSGLKGLREANNFYVAFIDGIETNMTTYKESEPTVAAEGTIAADALACVADEVAAKAKAYMAKRYPRRRTVSFGGGYVGHARAAGAEAGAATSFRPGMKAGVKMIGA